MELVVTAIVLSSAISAFKMELQIVKWIHESTKGITFPAGKVTRWAQVNLCQLLPVIHVFHGFKGVSFSSLLETKIKTSAPVQRS
jgi:hypothetical protein